MSEQFFQFVAVHYLFALVLGLTSYLIGYGVTRQIQYDSVWEEASTCISLGLGLISYLVFFLGLAGLLYRSVIGVILALSVALGYRGLVRIYLAVRAMVRSAGLYTRASVAFVCFGVSLPVWALPLYPPTAFDATMYFLTSAKLFANGHRLVVTPYLRFGVLTQLNEMLFTLALILYDDIAAQLVQFLMLIVLMMALIGFGRRCFSRQSGWWAASILVANPIVLWAGATAYLEIAIMLFSTMAAYAFWNWYKTGSDRWLLLSGAFCGFAASTKYPGLFVPLFLGIVSIFIAVRRRRYSIPFILAAATFATGVPWYLRNFYYTRNPVFPFLPQIFGYSWFTRQDLEGLLADMHLHGVGRNVTALLWIPWHLTFNQDVFLSEYLHLSQIYFYCLPIVVFFVFKDSRVRQLISGVLAFTFFWFYSAQILRYILPVIPLLSVVVAGSIDLLLGYFPVLRKLRSHYAVIAITSLTFASGGWLYARGHRQSVGPIPTTKKDRDDYLTRQLPSYPIYRKLNEIRGKNYSLYAVYDENMAYFVDGRYQGDWFGPATYGRIFDKLNDGQALFTELKKMGVDYFLLDNRRNPIVLPYDTFFNEHFHLVYSVGTAQLFELSDKAQSGDSSSLEVTPQLLANPGFEDIVDGKPSGWENVGGPILDKSGKNSHSGSSAIRCIGSENVLFQVVPVKAGTVYKLGMEARSSAGDQHARLQVNWSDGAGKFISADLQVVVVKTAWNSYESVVKAPPHAANAVIYAACHDMESAWLDDFSFRESSSLWRD
jgi:hypothetical protein